MKKYRVVLEKELYFVEGYYIDEWVKLNHSGRPTYSPSFYKSAEDAIFVAKSLALKTQIIQPEVIYTVSSEDAFED